MPSGVPAFHVLWALDIDPAEIGGLRACETAGPWDGRRFCKGIGTGTKEYMTSIERARARDGIIRALRLGNMSVLSSEAYSPASDDNPQKRGAKGRDRHVGQ